MNYIAPPPPPDSEIIYEATEDTPAFTWGDHRQLEAMLADLEAEDPVVAAARTKLDAALTFSGLLERQAERVCQWCWHKESEGTHDKDCRDYDNPALHVSREAGAYQYFDEGFALIHTTSVPMTDEEALEYFSMVDTFLIDATPKYIARREMMGITFKMMPWWYEPIQNIYLPTPHDHAWENTDGVQCCWCGAWLDDEGNIQQ